MSIMKLELKPDSHLILMKKSVTVLHDVYYYILYMLLIFFFTFILSLNKSL